MKRRSRRSRVVRNSPRVAKPGLPGVGVTGVAVAMVVSAFASTTSSTAVAAASSGAFRAVKVATADKPIGVMWHPTTKAPYVIEQSGKIRALEGAPLKPGTVALDVTKQISTGGEQGLLGAAFANDGELLFVNLTNSDGDTQIREYRWESGVAAASSMRLVLEIAQPYSNHNGGHVVVDAAGLLWIGMGDGGSGGDPENVAQNLDSLLGKMLRIDPRPDGNKPYRIPADNPFVGGGGRPEIWAYGLRNPWRYDIDPTSKRLFIGDVGQSEIEEINVVPLSRPGANFGWKLREGSKAFNGGAKPAGALDPITEYSHSDGCSVTGGVFYRGKSLKGLAGRYFYGDYCKGWIASVGQTSAGVWKSRKLGVTVSNLSSFNTTPDGEMWVTSTSGSIHRLTSR
jgi:glucose/arabinose dehydrogenase